MLGNQDTEAGPEGPGAMRPLADSQDAAWPGGPDELTMCKACFSGS